MAADRTIAIFGCSRGIGRALAEEYARRGAKLVLLSRDVEAIRDMTRAFKDAGGQAWYRRCDVTVHDDVREGIAYARKCLGSVDVVVVNAGVGSPEWMKDFHAADFHRVFETNTMGIARALEECIPVFQRQGGGVFAGVTSIAEVRGFPGSASYCASKAAASRLLEAARVELYPLGIRVLTVRPGFVRTAMIQDNEFPMPFVISPQRAARIIRRGIARRRRVIQFPWPTVLLSRIIRVIPNVLYETAARRVRPAGKKS